MHFETKCIMAVQESHPRSLNDFGTNTSSSSYTVVVVVVVVAVVVVVVVVRYYDDACCWLCSRHLL